MPCEGIQVQPGCCEGCSVAFENATTFLVGTGSCLGSNYMTNALSPANIGNLSQYRLLFLGPSNTCDGTWYSFTTAQNLAIKAWVEAGGRLWAGAEYVNCFNAGNPSNRSNYNTFLGVLGASLQLSNDIEFGCSDGSCSSGVPRPVPIMSGLAGVWHFLNGRITGGTEICRQVHQDAECNGEISFVNAERIGEGIVFACADSNVTVACGDPALNCEFFQRICNWPVADMLPAE